ncbi:hypothetical protein [Haloactinomyces albus]|uniref:ABC-type multidrug transport system permease subunit n=1 Tax=Haloactinomyces albus TaxID=1352928 RepID=A0AAE4CN19_9ACTN|nr:hypothetical protein [Haloactinomyces albus]MDR7301512.1 ABC-type multidrug transport system permease subunit [Haloactinomyces albus]
MTHSARRPATTSAAVTMFGIGLLAVLVIFGLFAAGYRNLPVWLNLAAMLAPLGLAVGLVAAIGQVRQSARHHRSP